MKEALNRRRESAVPRFPELEILKGDRRALLGERSRWAIRLSTCRYRSARQICTLLEGTQVVLQQALCQSSLNLVSLVWSGLSCAFLLKILLHDLMCQNPRNYGSTVLEMVMQDAYHQQQQGLRPL